MVVDSGLATTDTVFFSSLANGTTGSVVLTATESGSFRDSGTLTVTVGSTTGTQQAPVADVASVNPGTTVPRELCLTASLGPASAAECGDLRLVHALPVLTTRGVGRAPALLFGSHTTELAGNVAAILTLPSGAKFPDSVEAVLKVGGVTKDSARWGGAEFIATRGRRVMLRDTTMATLGAGTATGVYSYTLTPASIYGTTRVVGPVVSGNFTVVDRRASAYGKGWWIAGLEQLIISTSLTWIGGDGSTRIYAPGGANTWVAPNVSRPDSIVKVGVNYERLLRMKGKIVFDASGRHVYTVNRLSDTTAFFYTGTQTKLDSILTPKGPGAAALQQRGWRFDTAPPIG